MSKLTRTLSFSRIAGAALLAFGVAAHAAESIEWIHSQLSLSDGSSPVTEARGYEAPRADEARAHADDSAVAGRAGEARDSTPREAEASGSTLEWLKHQLSISEGSVPYHMP